MDDAELAYRLRVLADEAADADARSGPLGRLALLRRLRVLLDGAEGEAIWTARLTDHEWTEIGAALGMSPQGAGKRFRAHHALDDPRPVQRWRRRTRRTST